MSQKAPHRSSSLCRHRETRTRSLSPESVPRGNITRLTGTGNKLHQWTRDDDDGEVPTKRLGDRNPKSRVVRKGRPHPRI